ncbi:MAG: hypothetical protein IJ498_09135, partial [Akkermansia sp.]|nr:hypothetical protein [Akkermansia sp.]
MKLHLPVLLRKALLACFSFTLACSMNSGSATAADLTLGGEDSLTIDYDDTDSIPDLENGTLQLRGDTSLLLSNCGSGDGKTYTLLTGVSRLIDAQGNIITLDSSNNTASLYFDTSQPGIGFWADATLQLTSDGVLQLVRYMDISVPTGYQEVPADDVTDIESYSSSATDVAFRITQDLSIDGRSSSLMAEPDGSWYLTSDSVDKLSSLTFCKASDTVFDVASSEKLDFNGLKSVEFSGNTASTTSSSSSDSTYAYGGAIYGDSNSRITLSGNGSVTFSENTASSSDGNAYGGAIYGDSNSRITLSGNGCVTFIGNTASSSDGNAYGGAIYGGSNSTITLNDNQSVEFFGNAASASYPVAFGGAICGYSGSTITLSGNGSVEFSGNTTSGTANQSDGGAIYGKDDSTITLNDNGIVTFSGNTASSSTALYSTYVSGGAICGYSGSMITLSDNQSVTFSGNTASASSSSYSNAYGGAIMAAETLTLSNNGNVIFSGNSASSTTSSSFSFSYAHGGVIVGGTITLSGNGNVIFSGNSASSTTSSSSSSSYAYGGAIHGGTITLSGNGSVTFSENSASSCSDDADTYGGAIYAYGNLSIRNNDSVLFEKNAEVKNGTYRLRCIYTGGSGDVISLSAAEGKSIEFRDSVYIASGSTVELNADYTDAAGVVHKQTGDIIFTGATTVDDLYEVKGDVAGTEEEIRLSRTTEVCAMTNLYGGRLRVEDGAIYKGYGITVHEGSAATVLVKDAELNHVGYELTFHAGSTLELAGNNSISGDVRMLENSALLLNIGESVGCTDVIGNLDIAGGLYLAESGSELIENGVLLYVTGELNGWTDTTFSGSAGNSSVTWVDNLLVLNYNEATFNRYFRGDASYCTRQLNQMLWQYYQTLSFELCCSDSSSGGAIYGDTITLSDNGSVTFSGNRASYVGGAIYGVELADELPSASASGGAIYGNTITLSGNGSVEFIGNTATASDKAYGGAIYGDTVTLSGNGSVTFSENTSGSDGGAIYAGSGSTITLSGNASVEFSGNSSYYDGGAIYGGSNSTITLRGNDSVTFSKNSASFYGGAIYGGTIELSGNGSVEFRGNTAFSDDPYASGGAICGSTIALSDNGIVTFSGNTACVGGAIETFDNLSIRNNDSVLFERNAKISNDTYRLRSIYAGGSGDVISLSAAEGKSIEFRDSVYIASGSTVELNADYTD